MYYYTKLKERTFVHQKILKESENKGMYRNKENKIQGNGDFGGEGRDSMLLICTVQFYENIFRGLAFIWVSSAYKQTNKNPEID